MCLDELLLIFLLQSCMFCSSYLLLIDTVITKGSVSEKSETHSLHLKKKIMKREMFIYSLGQNL